MNIIEMKHITKYYQSKPILQDFSMTIAEGECVALTGPSGCGKSTLLNIMGLLEDFDEGEYTLFGHTNVLPHSRLASRLLRGKIGYLFQNYALVDDETVYDNMRLAVNRRQSRCDIDRAIIDALAAVGLGEQDGDRYIFTLSGGEQQRVAFARLLLRQPTLVLADEPTGSLDPENRDIIMNLLQGLNDRHGTTVVIVTHDSHVAKRCRRVFSVGFCGRECV